MSQLAQVHWPRSLTEKTWTENGWEFQFLWSLLLALLVYIGLIVYGDWRQLTTLLVGFPWMWLPPVLALTLVNFGVRLLKWHWYLRLIRTPISFGQSARIYGISFLMMMTPGKVGEFVRAFMVRNVSGTPVSVVAPVVLAERMTDGLAMILLAGIGLLAIADETIRLAAVAALLVIAAIIVAIQIRPLALWCLALGHRIPLVNRFADKLAAFYESSYFLPTTQIPGHFGPDRLIQLDQPGSCLFPRNARFRRDTRCRYHADFCIRFQYVHRCRRRGRDAGRSGRCREFAGRAQYPTVGPVPARRRRRRAVDPLCHALVRCRHRPALSGTLAPFADHPEKPQC